MYQVYQRISPRYAESKDIYCRHTGISMPVLQDQFAEQTYSWQGCGTGGFRGISPNADQVAV